MKHMKVPYDTKPKTASQLQNTNSDEQAAEQIQRLNRVAIIANKRDLDMNKFISDSTQKYPPPFYMQTRQRNVEG